MVALREATERAYERAAEEVDEALRSGSLLRGEVLARWYDVVGTGDFTRALESRVAWARDRLRSFVTGKPPAPTPRSRRRWRPESRRSCTRPRTVQRRAPTAAWRETLGGRALLAGRPGLDVASAGLEGGGRAGGARVAGRRVRARAQRGDEQAHHARGSPPSA